MKFCSLFEKKKDADLLWRKSFDDWFGFINVGDNVIIVIIIIIL